MEPNEIVAATTRIVSAYVANNPVASIELPDLIRSVHASLLGITEPSPAPIERPMPAVAVKKSVTTDAIVCLECGKPQKMLKRHLRVAHGLTPVEYREKWDLPRNYPMVAPDYSGRRSELAKANGLGKVYRRHAA